MHPKEFLNRREASEYLKNRGLPGAVATLAKLACVGGGPVMHRFGARRVLYLPADLDAWAESKLSARCGTSDGAAPAAGDEKLSAERRRDGTLSDAPRTSPPPAPNLAGGASLAKPAVSFSRAPARGVAP
jgi:hypothetical protein